MTVSDLPSSKVTRHPAATGMPESNITAAARSAASKRRPEDEVDNATSEPTSATEQAAQAVEAAPSESGGAGPSATALTAGGGIAALGLVAAAAGGGGGGTAPKAPPSAVQPEASKPEVPTPDVPKPEVPKPEVPTPEVPKPEASKPEVSKPESPDPSGEPGEPGEPSKPVEPEKPMQPVTPTEPPADGQPTEPTPEVKPPVPVDTTPPAAVALALKHDTGPDATDRHTSDATITVAGLEPDASWRYSVDSGKTWHDGSGQEFVATVADGLRSVQVIQRDQAGNDSAVASLEFTLETGAPTLALKNDTGRMRWNEQYQPVLEQEAFAHDGITKDGTLVVNGLKAGATWDYSLDQGQHWIAGSGNEIAADALGADGVKTVQVRQTDVDGNTGYSEFSFTLDTTAAALRVRLRNDDGFDAHDLISSDPVLLLQGLEPDAVVSWYDGFAHKLPGQLEFDISATEGVVGLYGIRQFDVAGNVSPHEDFEFAYATGSGSPALNDGRVRFGTSGADVFKVDVKGTTIRFFNYERTQGDVIDLSAIAASGGNIRRDSGSSLVVEPEGGDRFSRTSLLFKDIGPVTVMTADGKVFDV